MQLQMSMTLAKLKNALNHAIDRFSLFAYSSQKCINGRMLTPLYLYPTYRRMILAWQRPLSYRQMSFTIYRGPTDRWVDSRPLREPIFCAVDSARQIIEYQCMDDLPADPATRYYWLVAIDDKNQMQQQGPFIVQMYKVAQLQTVSAP